MPAYEVMGLNDKAVLWPIVGRDRHNEPLRGPACTVSINFSADRRMQRQADNTTIVIEGTAVVGRSFNIGDLLWLGVIAEYDPGKVTADNPIMSVYSYREDQDLKGRRGQVLRTIKLSRYGGTLPPKG